MMFNGICFSSNIITINDALFFHSDVSTYIAIPRNMCQIYEVNILSEISSVHLHVHLTFPSVLRKSFKFF